MSSQPKPATIYLGLGSNMGDSRQNLALALKLLGERVQITKLSSIYDTEPVGNVNQRRFLNMVCEVQTTLTPQKLLSLLKGIESKMGRVVCEPNSPRPIDIDILFYNDLIMESSRLIIPHPRLMERAFVLVPLAEIAPDFVHPVSGKTVREMESRVSGKEGVIKATGEC